MAQLVSIAAKNWALGLEWFSFEEKPSKHELAVDAERLNANWYAIREGEMVIQVGFCKPINGRTNPKKIYSLASLIAESHEEPWAGTYQLTEDLFWYIAVRDEHAILPDGDVVGNLDDVLAAKKRHAIYNDWNFTQGNRDALVSLIDEMTDKPDVIKSLSAKTIELTPLLTAGLMVMGLAGGAYYWYQGKLVAETQARLAQMQQMQAKRVTKTSEPLDMSPLLTQPMPNAWVKACGEVILDLPLSHFGWTLQEAACNGNNVIVKWMRGDGATVEHKPEGELAQSGNEVVSTIPIRIENKGEKNEAEIEDEKLQMQAWAQSINLTVSFLQDPALPLPLASPNSGVPPTQSQVRFETTVSPFSLDFSGISGLRIKSIKTVDILKAAWTVEAVLYGK